MLQGEFPIAGKRILVIKHGALGDIVLAMGPFRAIRDAHAADHLTLLTGSRYASFLQPSGLFNTILIDDRPPPWRIWAWLRLFRGLRAGRFDRVYDLQHSNRTSIIYRLLATARALEWSGIAKGCSHPHNNPHRDSMHTIERQAEQLALAGIAATPDTDLAWVEADIAKFALPNRYALLVPGGAPHRPEKRWPVEHYTELAAWLVAQGCTPVLLGGDPEIALLRSIGASVPGALNLAGQTDFAEIVGIARDALVAIGNDTGPMHLVAASDCPSIVLFSSASDPSLTAPRGLNVEVMQMTSLTDLSVDKVVDGVAALLASTPDRRRGSLQEIR